MPKELLESDESGNEDGGVTTEPIHDLKVNADFAKRFVHNKKREELRRLEDKLGPSTKKRKREDDHDSQSSGSTSSESEVEDDDGELATEALDSEIFATLNAIRSKDPRVYDEHTTFYTNEDGSDKKSGQPKEKPIYLRDYHRQALLDGHQNGARPTDGIKSHLEEQEELKKSIIGEINAAEVDSVSDDPDPQDNFLIMKERPKQSGTATITHLDVEGADRDPETYLSNFMASRAWVPKEESRFQAFESDDEDEERKAEEFEEAYNFRFEDPDKSNERLRTHARDLVDRYSVRRDEKSARQRKRDLEKAHRNEEKQEREAQKARLRKLRVEQVEEKVRRIKRAAGLSSKDIRPEDWARFVNDDWDDDQWNRVMRERFGEEYYAGQDVESETEDMQISRRAKRNPKKPKWDDDIVIKDIVPDFEEQEKAEFSLTEDEVSSVDGQREGAKHPMPKAQSRKEAKKDRKVIEQLVERHLEMDTDLLPNSAKKAGFRYRETSPTSFGLSAGEILLADDAQLNQYAGLKKLAAYRDPEKKQKDRKYLGKRARLRQWRKDTFGDESGLHEVNLVPDQKQLGTQSDGHDGAVNIRGSVGKKRRRRNHNPSRTMA